MLSMFLLVILCFLFAVFYLTIRSRSGLDRVLMLSLLSSLVVIEIVLYALHTNTEMYLDIALAFALLSFMDIQFYCVFLRRKGDLGWSSLEKSSSDPE